MRKRLTGNKTIAAVKNPSTAKYRGDGIPEPLPELFNARLPRSRFSPLPIGRVKRHCCSIVLADTSMSNGADIVAELEKGGVREDIGGPTLH
jgi:hypothetical protein